MKAYQAGSLSLPIATTHTYQDFRSHKTDGNKGKDKVSFSLGKHPITGEKLPLIRKGEELLSIKNFNQKVDFIGPMNSSESKIVCRHFSLYALSRRLENNSFKVYETFKNEETIIETLGGQQKNLEDKFTNAYKTADAVYILYKSHKDWYDFLNSQFTLLEGKQQGDRFFCLLNTPMHTMTLEGLIGRSKDGKLFYRLKFYDPNQTVLTHTVESTSKKSICKKTILTFLREQAYKKHKAKIVTVAVYYLDNQWQPNAQPVFNTTLTSQHLHSEVLFNIMQDGLTKGLEQFLALAMPLGNGALFELLNAQDHKDRTALFLAIDTDRSDAIAVLTNWLIKKRGLTQAQVFELLLANSVSHHLGQALECTGLQKGLALGNTQSVEVFIEACKQAIAENKINSEQLVILLRAQGNKSAPSGLCMALQNGHKETVTAFIKGVASIPQLNGQIMVDLFSAISINGTPGLTLAFGDDHAQSVMAFVKGCAQALATDKINSNQLITLLSAKDRNNNPALFFALQDGYNKSITAFMETVLDIPELDNKDVVELFLAKNNAGAPGVGFASDSGNTQTISAYLKGCIQAFTDGKINIDQLMILLSAKDGTGVPGLYFALSQGKNTAVLAFIAPLINFLKNDKLTFSQFINLIAAETEQGQLGIEAVNHPQTLEIYQRLLYEACKTQSKMEPFRDALSTPNLPQDTLIMLFKKIQHSLFQPE